jgi:uncharacterized protein YbjT (DUF2867 family)
MDLGGVRVLAFGTDGAQGSGLIEALTARGAEAVRASSRDARVDAWRAEDVRAVRADLLDPASVAAAAHESGAAAAALHVPLGAAAPGAVQAVVASVRGLREAGLPVAVNLGTPVAPPGAPDPFGVRDLAAALTGAGAAVATPTGYLENHASPWALEPLRRGELVYPRPADDEVAWITARDVTAALVAALAGDAGGELLVLAGPQRLTFDALAAQIAAGTGREVVFRSITPAEYGDLLRPVLGDAAADGVTAAYSGMPTGPNPLMSPDAGPTWQRLGVSPTTARDWAAQHLAPLLG